MTRERRLQALACQGTWLTDDQIRFGLDTVAQNAEKPVQVIDPIIMQRCLQSRSPSEFKSLLHAIHPGDEVITAFVYKQRWITMHWKCRVAKVTSWVSVPRGVQVEQVAIADWLFSHDVGCSCRYFEFQAAGQRPGAAGLCGHFAIVHLAAAVYGAEPLSVDLAMDQAAVIASAFGLCVPDLCRAPALIGGAINNLLEQSVASLLIEKGAIEGDIHARASAVITREAVQRALQSPAPWRQMKATAGTASPPLQLILPSELQRQLEARIAKGGKSGREGKKKAVRSQRVEASLAHVQAPTPEQVQVPMGVFVNGTTGVKLGALSIADISPQAEGVILATQSEATPYLSLDKPVSSEALALLVMGDVAQGFEVQGQSQIRFQAMCRMTGEPLLLNAAVVQLGVCPVAKAAPAQVAPLEIAVSTIIRVCFQRRGWARGRPSLVARSNL